MYSARRIRMLGPATSAFIGLGLLCGTSARAEDTCDDEALLKAKVSRQQQAQAAGQLIARLHLSRSQARQLIPIVEEAARLHADAYRQEARLLPQMIEAFSTFAAEDRLNRGFSREVEHRAGQMDHRARQVREDLTEKLIALEQRASAVLSPAQRAAAESSESGRRYAEARNRSRRHSAAARRQRQAARNDRLAAARQEIHQLYQQLHPRLSELGQRLLHPAAAEMVCRAAGQRPTPVVAEALDVAERGLSGYTLERHDQEQVELSRLRTEINNWNLINGLHLTSDQIERITALYSSVTPTGGSEWDRTKRPGTVPHTMHFALERAVEEVLNPGQRQVVIDYQACLIPPRNLKDPVRVGQAADADFGEQWLTRARTMSEEQLTRLIGDTLKREAEHLGQLSAAAEKQRKLLLRHSAQQAARLSDTEFELNKSELGERITRPDRKEELKHEIAMLSRTRGRPGAIAQHMLQPTFMAQLRLRAGQLAQGVDLGQSDLAAGPQAENCEKGCAIDTPDDTSRAGRNRKTK
ncbi:MAG: hypothetical protein KKB50_09745 [Planctomycetes bacterium]|nr:hypothetical protein [Planctomycetota bacterium]